MIFVLTRHLTPRTTTDTSVIYLSLKVRLVPNVITLSLHFRASMLISWGSQALAYINIRSHKQNLNLGVINCWKFYFTIKVGNFTHCVAEIFIGNENYTA